MAISPDVLALLEEMLDTGRTAEDVCSDHPQLLSEVRRRWKTFRLVDNAVAAFLPDTKLVQGADTIGATGPNSDLPQVAGYNIEAELGHGGMGIVYRAWHLALNRPVALKMLLAGAYAGKIERERFQREAQAVAGLRHPNIVQVYDVGEVGGRPYFTMELVEGGSLADQIKGVPQPAQLAAELIATLADAVGVAHESAIVHRDLKPSNILLTTAGTPKVTDFGLARRLGTNGDLTLSGTPIGTPSYMSPCQARGDKSALSPATDVYALGAILYELLTGRPPFHAETATATLHQVLSDDPVSPVRLNARVPRDLETICLKCLEKDPQRRYPTGAALAADLRRFLQNEPILARPIGYFGRLARWARRHPGTAASSAALIVTVLAAMSIILWEWREAETARRATDRMATRLVLDRGIILCERGQVERGLQWFARGMELAEKSGNTELMLALRTNLAAWSPHLATPQMSPSFGASITAVAFHPDGKRLLVGRWANANGKDGPGVAQVVDVDSWQAIGPPLEHSGGIRSATFSPDGQRILTTGAEGTACLSETESGQRLIDPIPLGGASSAAAFASNGRIFATATITSPTAGEARIWDVSTGQPLTPALRHLGMVHCLAFSPDGKQLVTGSGPIQSPDHIVGGEVRCWDADTGRAAGPVFANSAPVTALAFSPDGQTIVAGTADGLLLRWRCANWQKLSPPMHHLSPLRAATFSNDGHNLLTGTGVSGRPKEREAAVRLWDLDSGNLSASPWIHPREVESISRSPDGRRFATGCADGHVRIFSLGDNQPKRWRYLEGIQITVIYGLNASQVIANGDVVTTFSPDGHHLLVGGDTSQGLEAARIVEVLTGKAHDLLPDRKSLCVNAALVVGLPCSRPGVGAFTALGGVVVPSMQPSQTDDVSFSLDGRAAATVSARGKVRLWNVDTASAIKAPVSFETKPWPRMTRLVDAQTLVIGTEARPSEIWDLSSGKRIAGPILGEGSFRTNALSPDGRTLATAGDGGIIQLWDPHNGKPLGRFDAVNDTIWSLRFSPDGRTLFAGGKGTAWLFDAKTGKQLTQPLSHPATVWEAQFSPDGVRMLTVCSDEYRDLHPGTVQVWDIRTGTLSGPALPHRVAGLAAAFDSEGRLVATGGYDGDVRFWDAATCAPVGPALIQTGPIPAIAFVSGTKLLAAAGQDGSLVLWPVPEPHRGSASEVREWVQSLTGPLLTETDALAEPR